MNDRIPPVAPEGCAWMPCDLRGGNAPRGQDHAWRHQTLGWQMVDHHEGAGTWDAAACLMRRLGPSEDPNKNTDARYLSLSAGWDHNPANGNEHCNAEIRHPAGWYAPVRFAGKVPDFGETGLRWADVRERVDLDEVVLVVGEADSITLPITLPPLPKPEHDDPETKAVQDMVDAAAAAYTAGLTFESFEGVEQERDELRAEVERLQARLREVEAERDGYRKRLEIDPGGSDKIDELSCAMDFVCHDRDEARAELERARELAHQARNRGPETYAAALWRIADGEV